MKLILKLMEGFQPIEINDESQSIDGIQFMFNTNINNVKIVVSGDITELLRLDQLCQTNSGRCVSVYIGDTKLCGVKKPLLFEEGTTTMVTNVSTVPMFSNGNDKPNTTYLNIDYYIGEGV